MQDGNKVYGKHKDGSTLYFDTNLLQGFTISLYEYEATIPTLWDAVKGHYEFKRSAYLVLIPMRRIH